MRTLGTPIEIIYTSNQRHGLENVHAFVSTPSGLKLGPFYLVELNDSDFKGHYKYIYPTDSMDEIGTYTVKVVSPSENNSVSKTYNFKGENEITEESITRKGVMVKKTLKGQVNCVSVSSKLKISNFKAVLYKHPKLSGKIKQDYLIGRLKVHKLRGILK